MEKQSFYEFCMVNNEYGKQLLLEACNNKYSDINNGIYKCIVNIAKCKRIKQKGINIDNKYEVHDIHEFSHGSGDCLVWTCLTCGKTWETQIVERTRNINGRKVRTGCPYCVRKNNTSYPEQFIYWSLKQLYKQTENRYKALKGEYLQGIEFDIAVPIKNNNYSGICIEYSPTWTHDNKQELDKLKKSICDKYNIRFIYIQEDTDNKLQEKWDTNYICVHIPVIDRDKYCEKIVDHILKSIGHSISEINLDDVKKKAAYFSHGNIEYEKSLEFLYPELVKEFNRKLNDFGPNQITPGSNIKIKWTCIYCGYGSNGEWEVDPKHRTYHKRPTGCPQCGYNWYYNIVGKQQKIKSKYIH